MTSELKNKRALACGSTQGIGRACAIEFARLGAEVTLVARNEAVLQQVAAELPSVVGRTHRYICVDFAQPDAIRDKVAAHLDQTGPVQILLNNTGGPAPGPIIDAKPEAFTEAYTKHVVCNQLLVQTLLPGMKSSGYGRIVNIISSSVREPIPGLGVSNTTRWAVAAWAKTLSRELAPFGITVNNILPGFVDTARLRSLIKNRAAAAGVTEAEMTESMISQIPTGRFADPAEVAAAVGFLASPRAGYITGINLPVDGGKLWSM